MPQYEKSSNFCWCLRNYFEYLIRVMASPLFPFGSVLVDLFTARLIHFFFSPPRRATNGRPFYCWCLTIFFFAFFSFCCIYQERNSAAWGQQRRKKPQHSSRHPFLNCWTGDEPAHHMEAVSYTELPSHHQQQKRAVHPFLSRILFFLSFLSILLINSDDDDFVFLKLFHRVEIHFYAAPGGRTRQCQDSFL